VLIATLFTVGRIELRVHVLREEQRAMPAYEEPPVSPGVPFIIAMNFVCKQMSNMLE